MIYKIIGPTYGFYLFRWDRTFITFFAREFGRVSDAASSDSHVHLYTPQDVLRKT